MIDLLDFQIQEIELFSTEPMSNELGVISKRIEPMMLSQEADVNEYHEVPMGADVGTRGYVTTVYNPTYSFLQSLVLNSAQLRWKRIDDYSHDVLKATLKHSSADVYLDFEFAKITNLGEILLAVPSFNMFNLRWPNKVDATFTLTRKAFNIRVSDYTRILEGERSYSLEAWQKAAKELALLLNYTEANISTLPEAHAFIISYLTALGVKAEVVHGRTTKI